MLMINPAGVRMNSPYRCNLNFNKNAGYTAKKNLSIMNAPEAMPNVPVNFRGAPYVLNLKALGVPEKGSITAKEAIKVFEKFKIGNYLDIGDDKIAYAKNSAIRKQNLEFLNRVTESEEKKEFIEYYKKLTGFPDLKVVSEKIKIEFVNTLMKVSESLNKETSKKAYNIVQAGYDGICSVGRGKALPGSDLDKAYVIINGFGDTNIGDAYAVKNFKWKLWDFTDQRILSYNHDEAAFPQVYTEAQLRTLIKKADEQCRNFGLREKKRYWLDAVMDPFGIPLYLEKDTERYNQLKNLQNVYTENYVAANGFYIALCRRFPSMKFGNGFDIPTKEIMKNVGFVIETLREGVYFTKFGKMDYYDLRDSITFNLTNLSQLKALKNRGDKKSKRLARLELQNNFNKWDTDKQYRVVKTVIESACANNTKFTDEFPQYFTTPGKDLFKPLIEALLKE